MDTYFSSNSAKDHSLLIIYNISLRNVYDTTDLAMWWCFLSASKNYYSSRQ